MPEPLDLDTVTPWLAQCGSCDAGLPMACTHPAGDYRPMMARLVDEVGRVESLRAELGTEVDQLAVLLDQTRGALRVALHHLKDRPGLADDAAHEEREAELSGCRIALEQATAGVEGAAPVRPGSSRRAQEEPGRIDTEWWNRRALVSDTLGRALWKRGHVVPLSVRDRCAEAVLAALDAGEPQPEQPTKAPWPSAEEAALLWHNTYDKHLNPDARLPWSEVPEPVRAVMIATAEKMLDFLRRRVGGIPAPKLAQGRRSFWHRVLQALARR